eukprot:10312137-Prorocentrum_lima.AAC.1
MLGEVRKRADEERTTRPSREANARLSQPHPTAAGAVTGPTSKGKGECNRFNTEEGCHLGRACPYNIQKILRADAMCVAAHNTLQHIALGQ